MNKKRLPLPPRVRAYLMSVPIEGLTIHLRLNGQFNTSLWTKLSFCFGGLITLFHCSIPRARIITPEKP